VHRDPEGKKRWVALVDGNETQIRILERLAEERDLAMPIVVDFIHVAEYVWEAAKALFPDDKKKQNSWVLEHMREILRGKATSWRQGSDEVPHSERWGPQSANLWMPVQTTCTSMSPIFTMKRGVPIATGVIEGACGYLVEARMNRSGAELKFNRR
jgi:hypothetical protein